MRKLVALFCVFNADKLLPHSIASVVNFVDEVRVYDGRFDVFIEPLEGLNNPSTMANAP